MTDRIDKCPKCGSEGIFQEEADIGVGMLYGPASCEDCGWRSPGPEDMMDEFDMLVPFEFTDLCTGL